LKWWLTTFGALDERDASWPEYEENAQIRFPEATQDPEIVTFNGQDYQGMANVYYPTTDGIDPRQRRAYDLLRAVYNLKAIDRFREQEGATYSAIVSSQQSRVSEGYGFFWVGLDVNVSEIDRMYDIADEISLAMAAAASPRMSCSVRVSRSLKAWKRISNAIRSG
jgi:zinc protease